MRLLVGTMHTSEQEFDACCAAIRSQTGVQFEHIVISGLPHKEAHARLYGTFMEYSSRFDAFAKVDADMVLTRRTVFSELLQWFVQHSAFDKLTIGVHDYFPDRLVTGLHAWRNTVRWPVTDLVFADSDGVPENKTHVDLTQLAPAAYHCPDPSDIQCFHYGVIRAVKVGVGLKDGWLNFLCLGLIEDTWKHLCRNADRRLALACLGAETALAGLLGSDDLDYSSHLVAKECAQYQQLPFEAMSRTIKRLRCRNRVRHPALLSVNNGVSGFLGRYALSRLHQRGNHK